METKARHVRDRAGHVLQKSVQTLFLSIVNVKELFDAGMELSVPTLQTTSTRLYKHHQNMRITRDLQISKARSPGFTLHLQSLP